MKISYKLLLPITIILSGAFAVLYFITANSVNNLLIASRQDNLSAIFKIRIATFTDEELSQGSVATSTRKKFENLYKTDPSIFRIKVWNKDLKIIYSDLENVIGLGTDKYIEQVKSSFSVNSQTQWSISASPDLQTPEDQFGPFIVGTIPLRGANNEIYQVVEIYSSTALLLSGAKKFVAQSAAVFSLFLFFVILVEYVSLLVFIIRPIQSLAKSAEVIGSGNLEEIADIQSKDEVGQLAKAFNEMATRLKESYARLEEKVKEKTNALSYQVMEVGKSKSAILNLLEDIEEEKKKVEQTVVERTKELNEEKARLLASINSLSFGFVIADTNDTVIVKNKALSTILELTEEPTSVKTIVDSFKGIASGLDVLSHSCRECIELKQVVELKEISHGKKYLRVFCTPVIITDTDTRADVVIGYVVLVEDVTEAKIMERSRDEFFAVASHELRTPLTAIRGNADMILEMYADKIVDKDMKEMLQDIDISSVRLISIVNDFLEVSRLEQGRIDIKKEVFNVSDIAEKVVRDLKAMIEQKGLSLSYSTPSSPLPMVYADKNRTEQILVNLVGNATKFTKEGSITIVASIEGNFVGIRVIDTGLGISEHNQALLFRKFQQAGEQMLARDVTQSTGLGLYISRLIISSMGGTIGLEKSELGKGSTFVFTLPIAEVK